MDPIILYVERRDRREIYGKSTEYDEFLILINGHSRIRLIGGTYHICLAYFSGLCKGIYTQNMGLYSTIVMDPIVLYTYLEYHHSDTSIHHSYYSN